MTTFQTLDGSHDHQPTYTFKYGLFFPSSLVYASYVLSLFLGFLSFKSLYLMQWKSFGITFALFLLFLFLATSYVGIQISQSTGAYREYQTFFGYKSGKWKSLAKYTDIAILTLNKKQSYNSITGLIKTSDFEEIGVYTLIPTHHKRILLKACKNKEEAVEWAKKLSNELEKNFTKFNPQISEASKLRRRR